MSYNDNDDGEICSCEIAYELVADGHDACLRYKLFLLYLSRSVNLYQREGVEMFLR